MRESRTFAQRAKTRKSDEAAKKYFLVYEGKETEVRYFDAVNDLRKEIGINPIIELRPLLRSYSEDGWSNPKKILERVIHNLEESRVRKITYETLLNRIMDYLRDEKIIISGKAQTDSIWGVLTWFCKSRLGKSLTDVVEDFEKTCSQICRCLRKEARINNAVSNISDIIKNQRITYAEGFDKICIIVDRDKHSFVAHPENNQYEYVLNTCRDRNFGLYITNPCFEFWLLLHFDKVKELDREMLLENPRTENKRRYAEQQLHKLFPGYKKSAYNAHKLVKMVDRAIKNEKLFCEDIKKLENNVGSNVGLLIEEMRKRECE